MNRAMGVTSLLLAAALAIGCQTPQQREAARARAEQRKREREEARAAKKREEQRKDEIGHDMFVVEWRSRFVDKFAQAQAAAGAYEDATLTDAHFDCGDLNALGRYKVNLLLEGARDKCAMIYVIGADADRPARLAAVDRFWKESRFAGVKLTSKEGYNNTVTALSHDGLNGLRKLDNMSENSGGSPTLSGGGTSGGSRAKAANMLGLGGGSSSGGGGSSSSP